jgi:hypothetical protein
MTLKHITPPPSYPQPSSASGAFSAPLYAPPTYPPPAYPQPSSASGASSAPLYAPPTYPPPSSASGASAPPPQPQRAPAPYHITLFKLSETNPNFNIVKNPQGEGHRFTFSDSQYGLWMLEKDKTYKYNDVIFKKIIDSSNSRVTQVDMTYNGFTYPLKYLDFPQVLYYDFTP